MLMESPLFGVPVAEIARACDVHPDTARRWKRTGNVPAAALRLIRALWEYDLGGVSGVWEGWRLVRGELVSPEGESFSPAAVRAGRYHRDFAQEAARRLAEPRQLLL
jgi:hypothetical protein